MTLTHLQWTLCYLSKVTNMATHVTHMQFEGNSFNIFPAKLKIISKMVVVEPHKKLAHGYPGWFHDVAIMYSRPVLNTEHIWACLKWVVLCQGKLSHVGGRNMCSAITAPYWFQNIIRKNDNTVHWWKLTSLSHDVSTYWSLVMSYRWVIARKT